LRSVASGFPAGSAEVIPADLTKEDDRQRVVARTIERFGGIDVLVNAAGIIGNGTIENTTLISGTG